MSERQETFHDIVEAEAWHDYDPEPDDDTPTEAEEAELNPYEIHLMKRKRPLAEP